jgi:hypothetical protein
VGWDDINFEDETLCMMRTLSKTKSGVAFNPPKTAKGKRAVA